jgi:hypothetical protein
MLKTIQLLLSAAFLLSATASAEPPPDPNALLRLVNERITAADSLSFHVEKRFDVVLSDGAKVEYSGALDVLVTRPRGLFMDYGDDLSARRVWYDGQTMTLLDSLKNLYVAVPVEGPVAEALDWVAREYDAEMPLAPLLRKDRLDEVESSMRASYLGIHDAEGEPCHHLLFRGNNADMQVWITIGDAPLLRKMVVTFFDIESSPQQSLTFSEWNLDASIEPEVFEAQLPEGARAIEFLPKGGE